MVKQKVQVWIYFQNPQTRVYSFLILKTRPERGGGFWQPITGGVHSGESLPEAALREAQEETGLSFQSIRPQPIECEFNYEKEGKQFQETGFFIHLPQEFMSKVSGPLKAPECNLPAIQLDPKEHVDSKWVTAKEAFKTIAHPSNASMLKVLLTRLAKQ